MSVASHRQFVHDLAKASIAIFEGGRNTASAGTIARAHFGDRSYSLNVVYDVQQHLKSIKRVLDTEFQLPVVLVSKDAYRIIQAGGPITRADARKCLPFGRGHTSDGIHLCASPDDLIYQTSIEMNLRQAAGKGKRNLDRLLDTYDRGLVSGSTLAAIADDITSRSEVSDPAVLAKIIMSRQQQQQQEELETPPEPEDAEHVS